jgi:hypothetical protein
MTTFSQFQFENRNNVVLWAWWHIPVIFATWEAEIGGSQFKLAYAKV